MIILGEVSLRDRGKVKRITVEAEGFMVLRIAGSKPIDLIGIKSGMVQLVECKQGKLRQGIERS